MKICFAPMQIFCGRLPPTNKFKTKPFKKYFFRLYFGYLNFFSLKFVDLWILVICMGYTSWGPVHLWTKKVFQMMSMPPRGWVGGFVGCRCGRRPRHSWRPIGEPCLHHVYNIPSQATNPNFKVYYLKLIVCETVGKYRNKVLMRSEGLCADLKGELERCVFSEYYSPKSQSNFNVKQPSTKRCVVSTWINNALMFDKIVHVLFVFFCCISAFLTALSWLSKWRHQGKNVCTRWRGAKRGKGNCDIRSRMWAAQNTKKKGIGPSNLMSKNWYPLFFNQSDAHYWWH